MRVVTWNCRRAAATSGLWDYFRELDADLALLQEVCGLPDDLKADYSIISDRPITKAGNKQIFSNVILVRWQVCGRASISSNMPWVAAELDRFGGNILGAQIALADGTALTAVCVYSPAWPVDRSRLDGIDVSSVRLSQNPDVWVGDLLGVALADRQPAPNDPWIVAGDFNLCETFDGWKGGPRGNREYLERLKALGFTDALRLSRGALTPTFRTLRSGNVTAQLDYMFLTQVLQARLIKCEEGDRKRVFGGLSDHLPVIADFEPQE